MDLTRSYERVIPEDVRARYELRETRNAAAVLEAANPDAFAEVVGVLRNFTLTTTDLVTAGGNKSSIAKKLDEAFRETGWREARVDTHLRSDLIMEPWLAGGERGRQTRTSEVSNPGYKVDNVKDRIALDVEWNAKDGNLDRDVSAYRAMYEMGFIDGAILITRTISDLHALASELAGIDRLGGTTTTNLTKLQPRMTRGDAGGCPMLAVAITARCWVRGEGDPDIQVELHDEPLDEEDLLMELDADGE